MVEGGRSGHDRIVRRLGDRRRAAALALRQGRPVKSTEPLSAVHLDGVEGDGRVRPQPTTFIEADGTSLKAALDIARKFGSVKDTVLPFDGGSLYTGRRRHSTRSPRS